METFATYIEGAFDNDIVPQYRKQEFLHKHTFFKTSHIGLYNLDYLRGAYEQTYNYKDGNMLIMNTPKIQKILTEMGIKFTIESRVLKISGSSALDLLYLIYKHGGSYSRFHYSKYLFLSSGSANRLLQFKVTKLSSDAKIPSKTRASDSGFDLTLVKLLKQDGNTYWYSTGISVEPPNGYYFDLVPRSSISKTGYTLANNVGVIDRSYTGDIIVVLTKINCFAQDLELPCKLVQIIPRQIVHMHINVTNNLSETNRGIRGFGTGSN